MRELFSCCLFFLPVAFSTVLSSTVIWDCCGWWFFFFFFVFSSSAAVLLHFFSMGAGYSLVVAFAVSSEVALSLLPANPSFFSLLLAQFNDKSTPRHNGKKKRLIRERLIVH